MVENESKTPGPAADAAEPGVEEIRTSRRRHQSTYPTTDNGPCQPSVAVGAGAPESGVGDLTSGGGPGSIDGQIGEQRAHLGLAEPAMSTWRADRTDAAGGCPPGHRLRVDPEHQCNLT